MPIIMECGMEYHVENEERDMLLGVNMIVSSSDGDWYDTTALLWDDFKIEGTKVFRLFDLLLDRKESRLGSE